MEKTKDVFFYSRKKKTQEELPLLKKAKNGIINAIKFNNKRKNPSII